MSPPGCNPEPPVAFARPRRSNAASLPTPEAFFLSARRDFALESGLGAARFHSISGRAATRRPRAAVREFMELLTRLGGASTPVRDQRLRAEGQGVLSFPLEGTSIAVDMVVSPKLQGIVDRLNEFVIASKGRIYLSKDRFTRLEHFRAMEPRLPAFIARREKWDPKRQLHSAQSKRLFGADA
jgi:hypothetical protein